LRVIERGRGLIVPAFFIGRQWQMDNAVSIWENSRRLVIPGLPVVTDGRTDNGRVPGNLQI